MISLSNNSSKSSEPRKNQSSTSYTNEKIVNNSSTSKPEEDLNHLEIEKRQQIVENCHDHDTTDIDVISNSTSNSNTSPRYFPLEPKERDSLLTSRNAHGILNLSWILITGFTAIHMADSYKKSGYPIDLSLLYRLSSDIWPTGILVYIFTGIFSLLSSFFFEVLNRRWFSTISNTGEGGYDVHWVKDTFVISLFVCSQFSLMLVPNLYIVFIPTMSPLVRGVLCMQSIILMAKSHSFFMVNRYKRKSISSVASETKPTSTTTSSMIKLFMTILEHLFMPTLVYEESFPRTKKIDWVNGFHQLFQFLILCICMYILLDIYLRPIYDQIASSSEDIDILEAIVIIAPVSLLIWVLGFYAIFHSFCNAMAEFTMFADRDFYMDWWNATCMSEFWRLWNRAVYKWFCNHIYVESMRQMQKINKGISQGGGFPLYSNRIAAASTQIVTAVLHEFVLCIAFKMFMPLMFSIIVLQIPYGMMTERLKGSRLGNVVMWVGLALGFPALELFYAYFYYKQQRATLNIIS